MPKVDSTGKGNDFLSLDSGRVKLINSFGYSAVLLIYDFPV